MPLISETDMIDRFGAARLAEVTTREGPVGGVESAVLVVAMEDAIAEVESYVGGRYDLANPPRVLTLHAAAIAWYRLLGDRAPAIEGAKANFDAAIEFLRRARAGDVALGDETPGSTSQPTGGAPAHSAPAGTFTTDTLKGF